MEIFDSKEPGNDLDLGVQAPDRKWSKTVVIQFSIVFGVWKTGGFKFRVHFYVGPLKSEVVSTGHRPEVVEK